MSVREAAWERGRMNTIGERMHELRKKIHLAREVISTGRDDGLAATLRLYIAELELEIEQIQSAVASTQISPPGRN